MYDINKSWWITYNDTWYNGYRWKKNVVILQCGVQFCRKITFIELWLFFAYRRITVSNSFKSLDKVWISYFHFSEIVRFFRANLIFIRNCQHKLREYYYIIFILTLLHWIAKLFIYIKIHFIWTNLYYRNLLSESLNNEDSSSWNWF